MQNATAGSGASAGTNTSRPGRWKRFVIGIRNLRHRPLSPMGRNVVVPDNPAAIAAPNLPVARPDSVVGPTSVGTVVMGTAAARDSPPVGVTVTGDNVPGQARINTIVGPATENSNTVIVATPNPSRCDRATSQPC